MVLQAHRCGRACTKVAQVQDTILHQHASLHPLLLTSAPSHSSLSSVGNWRNQHLEGVRRLDLGCVISHWQRNKLSHQQKSEIILNRIYMFSNLLNLHVYVKHMDSISFISAHVNHTKQWVSLRQLYIFISYTLIIPTPPLPSLSPPPTLESFLLLNGVCPSLHLLLPCQLNQYLIHQCPQLMKISPKQ